jgi:WD40-like Beta Propeller Repeat
VSNVEYSPQLAAALDRLVPVDETLAADWRDVVGRVGRRTDRRASLLRSRPVRLALVVAAVFLLLAGVATAAYFIQQALVEVKQPGLRVVSLDEKGRLRTVWPCPGDRFCGLVASVAVAADGRHLALSADALNVTSPDVVVHIIDLRTGFDRRLPAIASDSSTQAPLAQAQRRRAEARLFGCDPPVELAWSHDGSRLAYVCGGRIYIIRPDGTQRRPLRTGTATAYWPTWSPDGRRIAFSTGQEPVVQVGGRGSGRPRRWVRSTIYTVGLDGSHRRAVTKTGAAPDWSRDGRTIAYWAPGCTVPRNQTGRTRLVRPDGRDVTPKPRSGPCGGIGPADHPTPAWSPDGRRLAVETWHGLYVMDRDGSNVRAIRDIDGRTFGDARPAWGRSRREPR